MARKDDDVKRVIAEWVLTNGQLPGFKEKVERTKDRWDIVGPEGMVVWRGQGGKIANVSGEGPETLKIGVRPVLATSRTPDSVLPYTGADCCLFKITLKPGTRYLSVKDVATFEDRKTGELVLSVKWNILSEIAAQCKNPENWTGRWPTPATPAGMLKDEILARCTGRTVTKKGASVTYPPEDELMVYFLEGSVTDPVELGTGAEGKKVYSVTYSPSPTPNPTPTPELGPVPESKEGVPAGGRRRRGRTFRRKTLRRNKHGSRLARQSKHSVRNRHA